MPLLNLTLPADGDDITQASNNTPLQEIESLLNGNIDAENIKNGSITADEIANNAITMAKMPSEFDKGWTEIPGTGTYVSPTSMSFPSGVLAATSVGDKVRVDQIIAPTAYYPLTANSTDTKGGYNGTDTAITYTGSVANFNGTTSKIVIADNAALKPTGAFTIKGWFKTANTGAAKFLAQSYSQNTSVAGIQLYIAAGNVLTTTIGKNTGFVLNTDYSSLSDTVNVCDGNWHYVALTYQAGIQKLYLDGVLKTSGASVAPVYAATNYVRFGCSNSAGTDAGFMNGSMKDWTLINNFAEDAATIAANYAKGAPQTNADEIVTSYFNATAVTDTLVTLLPNSDYVLFNGAITNPYYSKAVSPVGFPGNFNIALPNNGFSTSSSSIFKIKFSNGEIRLWGAPDGTSNANTMSFTLPIVASAGAYGACFVFDNGGWVTQPGEIQINSGSTTMNVYKQVSGGAVFTTSGGKAARINISYPI